MSGRMLSSRSSRRARHPCGEHRGHNLPQSGLWHLAEHAGADPQCQRRTDGGRILEDTALPDCASGPDPADGNSRPHCSGKRERPSRSSGWTISAQGRTADRCHDGASNPDQPPDCRDALGRQAVPPSEAVLDILPLQQKGPFAERRGGYRRRRASPCLTVRIRSRALKASIFPRSTANCQFKGRCCPNTPARKIPRSLHEGRRRAFPLALCIEDLEAGRRRGS